MHVVDILKPCVIDFAESHVLHSYFTHHNSVLCLLEVVHGVNSG